MLENLDKQFFVQTEPIVKTFCDVYLKQYGIVDFAYARIYSGGRDAFVTNNAPLAKAFVHERFYERIYCAEPDQYVESFALSVAMGQDDIFAFYKEHFNVGHNVTLVKPCGEYTEFAHFSGAGDDYGAYNFFINNLDLLMRLRNTFRDTYTGLIKQAQKSPMIYPTPSGDQSILVDKKFQQSLTQKQSQWNGVLSLREQECVKWLSKAMTAKEIARELKCSFRTVEKHLDAAREKLHCRNRMEVVVKYLQLNGRISQP